MSAARLLRVAGIVAQADPALHAWLAAGLGRWRDGENLERALDLTGEGAVLAGKNALLHAAFLLDPLGARSPWHLAGELARALRDFELHRWPRAKHLDGPGALSVLDGELWAVLLNGGRIPRGQDGIYNLLAERGLLRQCSVPHDGREHQLGAFIK